MTGLDALLSTRQVSTDEHGRHVDDEGRAYRLVDVGGEARFEIESAPRPAFPVVVAEAETFEVDGSGGVWSFRVPPGAACSAGRFAIIRADHPLFWVAALGPVEPVPDVSGEFRHPGVPWGALPGDDLFQPLQFFQSLGFEYSIDDEPYQDGEPMEVLSDWWPRVTEERPPGEGWFLLSVYDSEDGGVAWWIRPQLYLAARAGGAR